MNRRLLHTVIIILLLAGAAGCFRLDTDPQLEVLVLDSNELPVGGAYVAVFESEAAWVERKNPAQAWRKTDAAGKVLFTDLREMKYFVYVRSGSADNSLGEYNTFGSLQVNRVSSIIIHVR